MRQHILVGASAFADATYGRGLAQGGHLIDIIERRRHIGANAFDKTPAKDRRRTVRAVASGLAAASWPGLCRGNLSAVQGAPP
jgi:hypothetical protein